MTRKKLGSTRATQVFQFGSFLAHNEPLTVQPTHENNYYNINSIKTNLEKVHMLKIIYKKFW